ncbi:DUF421 domain-containing protein [Bacillus megaterium]|nr:DUF421 domain-containing protein [Priestia megaterium]
MNKNGNLVEENLSKHQLNKQWLLDKLKQENIYHLSDVSYAEYEVERGLFIQRFNK